MEEIKEKSGNKYVILVRPENDPDGVLPYSTFKLACEAIGYNYNTFNKVKPNFLDGKIRLNGYVKKKKKVIR